MVVICQDPRISTLTPGCDPLTLLYPINDGALQKKFLQVQE